MKGSIDYVYIYTQKENCPKLYLTVNLGLAKWNINL